MDSQTAQLLRTLLSRHRAFLPESDSFRDEFSGMLATDAAQNSNIGADVDKFVPPMTTVSFGRVPHIGDAPYGTVRGDRDIRGYYEPSNDFIYTSMGAETPKGMLSTLGHEASHAQHMHNIRSMPLTPNTRSLFAQAVLDRGELYGPRWKRDLETARELGLPSQSLVDRGLRAMEIFAWLSGLDASAPKGTRLYDVPEAQDLEQVMPGIIDAYYKQAYGHLPGYTNRGPMSLRERIEDMLVPE